ncbi:MAG TPA: Gfo/Idh/MocA family oxidoreductase [Thermomicrobiales bacterium]|jgi:predicted dehydrogenase|nr:Gfo/Idh/MocA family oxidoreductase [Thermomicrobiales bacterium]
MLRVGIIGAGGIVRARHAPAWHKQQLAGTAQVTAISDIFEEPAQKIADTLEHNGQKPVVYTDFEKLIAEAPIDAVDICLPHHLHAKAILAAVANGKHVICEKPMCISLAEADQIVEAVDKAGITYMSGHNELFHPALIAGRRAIEQGVAGKPFLIRSHEFPGGYNRSSVPGREPQGTNMVGWRASKETMGGGVLIDKGYHPTYILLALARSEPKKVTAMMNTFVAQMDGEDTALVLVEFEDGSIGQIFTGEGFIFPEGDAKFHFVGSQGEIYGDRVTAHIKPRGFDQPSSVTAKNYAGDATFDDEIAHFVDAIETKRKPIQDHYDGRRVLEVIQAAYKSVETGTTVELPLAR